MQWAHGTYFGEHKVVDPHDDRWISVGFPPDFVTDITPISSPTVGYGGYWRTKDMVGDFALGIHGNDEGTADAIQAFGADGFQVGTILNWWPYAHSWLACRDDGEDDFAVGTYAGDGLDGRAITSGIWRPGMAMVQGALAAGTYGLMWRPDLDIGDKAFPIYFFQGIADTIQAISDTGFEVGTTHSVNKDGATYYYACWKDVADQFTVGTYMGDGQGGRDITDVNFPLDYMLLKGDGFGKQTAHRFPNDTDGTIIITVGSAPLIISAILNDGFTVENVVDVNANLVNYYWCAWAKLEEAPAAGYMRPLKYWGF